MNKQLTRGSQILFVFGFVFIIIMFTFSAAPTITRTSQDDVQHCDYTWHWKTDQTAQQEHWKITEFSSVRQHPLAGKLCIVMNELDEASRLTAAFALNYLLFYKAFSDVSIMKWRWHQHVTEHFEHCWDNNTCSQSTWEERHCAGFCSHWCWETTFPSTMTGFQVALITITSQWENQPARSMQISPHVVSLF